MDGTIQRPKSNCKNKNKVKPRKRIKWYDPFIFIYKFWEYLPFLIKNNTIEKYFAILGIDPVKLNNETSKDFYNESLKMMKQFFKYPTIMTEIFRFIITKRSKLDFLEGYSVEQIKYITNPDTDDTKLLACAGSGKTRSIIARIRFMVEHGLCKKQEVFAITFSKHAATDFHRKIKQLFPDFTSFCQLKNFSTIDSLAKSILCRVKSHKSENVEILSIALRNYLREIPEYDIEIIRNAKNIKYLFIDEAQDLNEVQYEAAMLLREKFGTHINLIGDPNQNIYQFRRSSSAYLLNFEAKVYELTLNFRSTQQIINFAEGLKPISGTPTRSATNRQGPRVTIITKSATDIHKMIIHFIKLYSREKDISNIAIISATRGIGVYDNVGLSVFFNLLKLNKIPFKQLYDESGTSDERKKDIDRLPGHVNLLTYHGTKGLEFDVVFVMDFYYFLYNIKPTEEEHRINRYLLYVAASRAISMMFVCTYTNVHGGYLNHWITQIKPDYYHSELPAKIPHLSFRDDAKAQYINGITEIITEMSDEQLDMIHDALDIVEDQFLYSRRIYPNFSHIDRGKDETLFGIFCEELFYLQYYLSRKKKPRKFSLIRLIIDSKFIIIEDDTDYKQLRAFIKSNQLTWDKYDAMRNTIPDRITYLIDKKFSRDTELNECIVCTNEFVKIIDANIEDIVKTYERYLAPEKYAYDYKKILVDFFYLIVVQYAYDINHYYYISDHGKEKADLLYNGSELFQEINTYVSYNYLACDLEIKIPVYYDKLGLMGEIDFIESYQDANRSIVEIKCVKEISIRYYIQLLLYNFCYYYQNGDRDKLFCNKFKIVNLLTGLEHYIIMSISPANMFNLLITMSSIGGLSFRNLNLVYDLETNDGIKSAGPYDHKPIIPRCRVTCVNNKYYGKIYPEIIEIAIKDYDTGMVLLDTLVCPHNPVTNFVQELTHIRPEMLVGKPDIAKIRAILEKKMKNFANCKMLAHNGARFDDGIILFDGLVDPTKVSFLDTLKVIPIHLPTAEKLDSKSLGKIYKYLFQKTFKAHRAMNDVDALIKIMQYLGVDFD